MKKTYAMIMTAVLLATQLSVLNVAADEVRDAANADEAPAFVEDRTYQEWTVTDIDVPVGADYAGSDKVKLDDGTASEIEEEVVNISTKESEPVVYVEVEWEDMRFVYDFGTVDKYEWDIEALDYVPVYKYTNGKGEEGWEKETAKIKFTNYSNRDVWAGCSFEKSNEDLYKKVEVSFEPQEILLQTAVGRGHSVEDLDQQIITMTVSGKPAEEMRGMTDIPNLGALKFYISEEARRQEPTPEPEVVETEVDGDHIHHYVYDQFGRLVCTGCNKVKHEYCVDFDEDGLCDECGLERDFCEDCHVGGTCRCT